MDLCPTEYLQQYYCMQGLYSKYITLTVVSVTNMYATKFNSVAQCKQHLSSVVQKN